MAVHPDFASGRASLEPLATAFDPEALAHPADDPASKYIATMRPEASDLDAWAKAAGLEVEMLVTLLGLFLHQLIRNGELRAVTADRRLAEGQPGFGPELQVPGGILIAVATNSGRPLLWRAIADVGDVRRPADLAAAIDRHLEGLHLDVHDGVTHQRLDQTFGLACQYRPAARTVDRPPSTVHGPASG